MQDFERKTFESPISLDASPEGRHLVSVNSEAYLRIWDTKAGKQLKRITTARYFPVDACFSPDGTALVHGAFDMTKPGTPLVLVVHRVGEKWPVLERLTLMESSSITGLGFSADGTKLWMIQQRNSGSYSVMSVWDWATRKCRHTITQPIDSQKNYIRSATLNADGSRAFLLTSSWDEECEAKLVAFATP